MIEGLTFDLCVGDLEFEDLELNLDDPDVGLRGDLCWFQTSLPLAALPRDHRLLFQSCSSRWQRRFGFITERHRSRVE